MVDFHESVLAEAVVTALVPAIESVPEGALVDVTCGAGGHTAALLARCTPNRVVLVDRDPAALEHARRRLHGAACTVDFCHAPFADFAAELDRLGVGTVSALIADLGVSSHQLDTAERGFSFRADAPLDMRMDPTRGETAAARLAAMTVDELVRVLRRYGEEAEAARIAPAILAARPQTTRVLAEVVEQAMSARSRRALGKRIHPATRTFQALRILVNGELDQLDRLLEDGPARLAVGGRMGVISFHSLEDRPVKQRFAKLCRAPKLPANLPLTTAELEARGFRAHFGVPAEISRKGVVADEAERERNPRSRSARLRAIERLHPGWAPEPSA